MSAPEGFRKGSWRGLPFVSEDHEQEGGRRLVQHQLPQVELPVLEDLGRKGGRFTLNCHIRGDGYIARANAFADALNARGVGTLVHPWIGSMQVGVEDFTRSDSTEEGGISLFSITFVESGLPAVAVPAADTRASSQAAAIDARGQAPGRFESSFKVSGVTAFVEKAAGDLIAIAAEATRVQAALLGGPGPLLKLFDGAIGGMAAPGLVRDAAKLGLATVNLVQVVSLLGSTARSRISAMRALLGFGDDLPPVVGTTPARAIERANREAFVQLVNATAAAELVDAIADAAFTSYQDAVEIRDAAADELDLLRLRQADAGDDAGAESYARLREALVRDVTARGGSLARLQGYVPSRTEPALVIAHRLYGDAATVEARADELSARNRVRHPGFVPGGVSLQVLAPEMAVANG